MAKNILKQELFDYLKKEKADGKWAGFQFNVYTKLGDSKEFTAETSGEIFEALCCQHGGTWTGRYTYVLV